MISRGLPKARLGRAVNCWCLKVNASDGMSERSSGLGGDRPDGWQHPFLKPDQAVAIAALRPGSATIVATDDRWF